MHMSYETHEHNQRVFIKTLGCKVNSYDSNALANQLKNRGFTITEKQKDVIFRLSTVAQSLKMLKEARYLLRRFQRDNQTQSAS